MGVEQQIHGRPDPNLSAIAALAPSMSSGISHSPRATPLRLRRQGRQPGGRLAVAGDDDLGLPAALHRVDQPGKVRSSCLKAIDGEDPERTWFRVIEFSRLQRFDGLLKRIEEAMTVDRYFGR